MGLREREVSDLRIDLQKSSSMADKSNENTSTYTFQRPSTCPLGLLDAVTVGFFDLIVVCVANVELNKDERNYLGGGGVLL